MKCVAHPAAVSRFLLYLHRFLMALPMGVLFPGTTAFKMPDGIRLCGRWIRLSFPDEMSLPSDVINVILDDEYGLKRMRHAPTTILDVGANIGVFSLWAKHHFPKAQIHAYEPNPRVLPYTQYNLAQIGIKPYAFAVGLAAGMATMLDKADTRTASTRISPQGEIEVKPIRSMIADMGGAVDLLKLDCEGAEWEVFKDIETMGKIETVRMEYHLSSSQTLDQFIELIRAAGFCVEASCEKLSHGILWLKRIQGTCSSSPLK